MTRKGSGEHESPHDKGPHQNGGSHHTKSPDQDLLRVPTAGELERTLGQNIGTFYRQLTGQQPGRVVCHLFSTAVGIVIEQSATPIERLLLKSSQIELADQLRLCINGVVRSEIKTLSEDVLGVSVQAVLIDSVLGFGYTGIFLMLADTPRVRNPGAIPKTEANRRMKKRQISGVE